ncbi:MAG: retroviral-like aspartic protease family protein, partial [Gemmatimonadota bacterium]|nr:retroviral-like aspartic protease family protein [Gemmatimonadota bacterium]
MSSPAPRCRLAVACVLIPLAAAACRPARPSVPANVSGTSAPVRDGPAFWTALGRLDLAGAARYAPDDEHRGFLVAMRLALAGDMPAAAAGLRQYYREGSDSLLRYVARATLTSVLTYQGDWSALYDISRDSAGADRTTGRDRAGVLAWSRVMRHAPRPRYPVVTRPVSIPMRMSATGVPVVTVRINGCTRSFWLDTGSSTTLVASDVAAACAVAPLVADTLEMVTTTGRIAARPAVVASLTLGAEAGGGG